MSDCLALFLHPSIPPFILPHISLSVGFPFAAFLWRLALTQVALKTREIRLQRQVSPISRPQIENIYSSLKKESTPCFSSTIQSAREFLSSQPRCKLKEIQQDVKNSSRGAEV
ncbi:hypothetical protein FQA47_003862 [Oryzias melastigma]|uniref:Uncharacterized protein n=1 Tax=Oryzias melastigma TaxID=30732 RepID=A0A834CJJ9_ORYME|nr:hypothetical protein FQA47_003862 [Oryzias melastigma]